MTAKNKHIGSTFGSFLDEEGIKEEVYLRAKKKILADQIRTKMELSHITVAALARKMGTSRTVLHRLLDPNDVSFTFATLGRASMALDVDLLVSLAEKVPSKRHKTARRSA